MTTNTYLLGGGVVTQYYVGVLGECFVALYPLYELSYIKLRSVCHSGKLAAPGSCYITSTTEWVRL